MYIGNQKGKCCCVLNRKIVALLMIVGNFPLALFELSHWQKLGLLKGKAHYLANKCLAKEVKSYILLSYYDSGSVKEKKKVL